MNAACRKSTFLLHSFNFLLRSSRFYERFTYTSDIRAVEVYPSVSRRQSSVRGIMINTRTKTNSMLCLSINRLKCNTGVRNYYHELKSIYTDLSKFWFRSKSYNPRSQII